MASLTDDLSALLAEAFRAENLEDRFARVGFSARPDLCQFQCNGALAAAKSQGENPRALAQRIIDRLRGNPAFSVLDIAGPGFINLSLTDTALAQALARLAADERLGLADLGQGQVVILDYGGANIAKAMHVGHLRAAIIGDALRRIFLCAGYRAYGDVHLGDWGLPMGMLIAAIRHAQPDLPYFTQPHGPHPAASPVTMDDLERLYPEAAARSKSDVAFLEEARQATALLQEGHPGYRALWQHFFNLSVAALQRDYGALGVHFDLWKGEAAVHDLIAPMIAAMEQKGLVERSDGADIIRVAEVSDKKDIPPLILRKRDGAVMYGTTDLATIVDRVQTFDPALVVYVVDQRQHLHFEQVFRAARQAGIAGHAALEHIGFGTMNGMDGKPFRTRDGGVLRLKDLIAMMHDAAADRLREHGLATSYAEDERDDIAEKVGLAALKFADLCNYPAANYVFDLERFTRFEGRTGPYLLYALVRITSLLRKAEEQDDRPGTIAPPDHDSARDLMLALGRFPDAFQAALAERAPNKIADYAFDCAQAFSRFYAACHILSEPDARLRAARLALASFTGTVLERCLALLGIEAPARM